MAPLPPESTARVYVDYNDGIHSHTLIARYVPPATPADILANIAAIFTILDPVAYAITISGARFSLSGSNVTNPETWPGDPSYGTGAMPAVNAPRQVMWGGKSPDGRLVAWYLFGLNFTTPGNYRFANGAIPEFDDVGDLMQAATANGEFRTVSGQIPLIKTYTNVNFNSYWEAAPR